MFYNIFFKVAESDYICQLNQLINNMKKFLFALVLIVPMMFVGCNKENTKLNKITDEAVSAIQKQLINGESLIIDSIKVIEDSIPYILDVELRQRFNELTEAHSEFVRIRDSYNRSDDEWFRSLKKYMNLANQYYSMRDSLKSSTKDFGYIALVNIAAQNTVGANQTTKAIVLFTDTLSLKPTGVFTMTNKFTQQVLDMLSIDEDVNLKNNKYGLIETDSLNPTTGFILDGLKVE